MVSPKLLTRASGKKGKLKKASSLRDCFLEKREREWHQTVKLVGEGGHWPAKKCGQRSVFPHCARRTFFLVEFKLS